MNGNVASIKRAGSSQLHVKPAATRELRSWIRTKLPDIGATLTWHVGANQVTHDADLSISAVVEQRSTWRSVPPADRPVWLRLIHASIEADPIEAVSIETRLIEPRKTRCRLRFLSSEALQGVISLKEERRLWTRFPALETHGELEWEEDGRMHGVAVEIVNISGGGAAVRPDRQETGRSGSVSGQAAFTPAALSAGSLCSRPTTASSRSHGWSSRKGTR